MADATNSVARERLSKLDLSGRPDRIEGYRVTLAPGQRSGVHHHPGGVAGVVTCGTVVFERDGEVLMLHAGDAFTELPGVTIARFDNASENEPAIFVAYYPLVGDEALLVPGEASP
jgi:quercetin dioxygenase-like cupin family protein